MYCKNCGNEILEEFETCPYCKTPTYQTKNSTNHKYQNNKFIPYYKQPTSIFQKHPFLSWTIAIIVFIVVLYLFLDNMYNFIFKYNKYSDKEASSSITSSNYSFSTIKLKNYKQIYDEYSQKLIAAGPTSSIKEMAQICNEGISKMAQYMHSAHGIDGQYSTYESWTTKLYNVYLNNCR